jgi:hypothetical protein
MRAKRHVLANALRVAAEQFDADALVHNDGFVTPGYRTQEGRQRVVDQFEAQAREARKLADEIEQAERIELED